MHPRFAKKFNALRQIDGDEPHNRWSDMKFSLLQFANATSNNNFWVKRKAIMIMTPFSISLHI